MFNLCPTCENAPEWARFYYYAPFVVIFQFGWASTQISHLSLIPQLTVIENERVSLNAIRYDYIMTFIYDRTISKSTTLCLMYLNLFKKYIFLVKLNFGLGQLLNINSPIANSYPGKVKMIKFGKNSGKSHNFKFNI